MKKISTTLIISLLSLIFTYGQTLVTTNTQLRNVVLEEFTGIHCTYCPEGHTIANTMADDNPGRVVIVNIHQGGYASPSAGEPDFRTDFGDAIAGQTGLTGYPSGTVNRHIFPGYTTTAMGRGSWTSVADLIFPEPSIVNVGFQSQFDTTTRELTVDVEIYYTGDSPQSTNYLNVALLENHIYGPQTGGNAGNNYDHKHMLRHLLTGQWGDTISSTSQGSLITNTYTYTIPDDYLGVPCNPDNCDIAVYITETHQEVYTGVMDVMINGSNDGSTTLYIGSLAGTPTVAAGTQYISTNFTGTATNMLSADDDFVFTLTTDAPADWSATADVGGNVFSDSATISIVSLADIAFSLDITPGSTPAFAEYTLSMSSASNPLAPSRVIEFSVISGITDLVVTGSGSWGDGGNYDFEPEYTDGLTFAGNASFAAISASKMESSFTQGILSGVNNIYLNIAWTFPSMSDDEATALMGFLDGGGNLFIAGQDMGWDIMSGSGYGTTVTQDFYTNYLHATYVDDGSAANNQLTANTGDSIFGGVSSSTIVDSYGGNMYPDQFTPTGSATAIFYYNSNQSKVSGLRVNTGTYKVVYIGIGMEMIQDNTVKDNILKLSHDWFYEGELFIASAVNSNASCIAACDGEAEVTVLVGSGPYTYLWDDPGAQTTATATGLCAGNYNVTITDSNNQNVQSVTIIEPEILGVGSITAINSSGWATNDGEATVIVTGGSGSYSYLWNDPSGQTTSTATSLALGEYIVSITDNNCGSSVTASVYVLDQTGISEIDNFTSVNIYPNPTSGSFSIDVSVIDRGTDKIRFKIYDIAGRILIDSEMKIYDGTGKYNLDFSDISNGLYYIKLESQKGTKTIKLIKSS